MTIKIGSLDVKEIYVGSRPVKAVYVGSKLVWSSSVGPSSTLDLSNYSYSVNNNKALIKNYTGSETNIIVPTPVEPQ